MERATALNRVVVLGPGGSGKSTFAALLSRRTGIPAIELDTVFWSADLEPLSPDAWVAVQRQLCQSPRWILDGDLGPYDVVGERLGHADAVVVLDLPLWRCVLRSLRRSRERLDFWRWLLTWRRRYRPVLLRSIEEHAPTADVFVLRRSADARALVARWPVDPGP